MVSPDKVESFKHRMPLSVGTRLGPYEILAPLGEGGMGEVWKARDTRLDRTVALKISKADFTERFEREARAIGALNHPHICQLYDVGPNYLVMEFIEGTRLKGPMPVERAVHYARQILEALDAAHKKGFTHRDLKPANILVTRQDIKLLDFGLAKHHAAVNHSDETLTEALTTKGQIVGTLQYMSPEQLQGKEADARSDLFAFGCVLYEMLSGKRAFDGSSAASVIAAILEREPAPIELGPPLERVIRSCLAKDPDQRFQTALDLKRALGWALEQQPAVRGPFKRWSWVAAAALALGVLAGWGLSRLPRAPAGEQAVRLQLNPPEGGQFNLASVALSPDGRTLAFVAEIKGKSGLWLQPLDGMVSRLLSGTQDANFPFWSPDGKSIGYFAANKLWRVDAAGGTPMVICDVADGRGGAWGSDGTIVFAPVQSTLRRVSASGGASTQLTKLDPARGEDAHYWPQLLPGGRFLYWARGSKPEDTGIYAASLAKPQDSARLIACDSKGLYAAGHLLWLKGSTLMAQRFDPDGLRLRGEPHRVADPVGGFATIGMMLATASDGMLLYGAADTARQFTWLDRSGKSAGTFGEPGDYTTFDLSPDGRRVVVSRPSSSGSDLLVVETERNVWSRFTFSAGVNWFPIWSPNGRSIVFRSGTPWNLFRKDSSGAGNQESYHPVGEPPVAHGLVARWALSDVPGVHVRNQGRPVDSAGDGGRNARGRSQAPPVRARSVRRTGRAVLADAQSAMGGLQFG